MLAMITIDVYHFLGFSDLTSQEDTAIEVF